MEDHSDFWANRVKFKGFKGGEGPVASLDPFIGGRISNNIYINTLITR